MRTHLAAIGAVLLMGFGCGGGPSDTDSLPVVKSSSMHVVSTPVQPDTSGWVHVPGALVNPDCVHAVPNGSFIDVNGDVKLNGQLIAHYDACPTKPLLTRPIHPGNEGKVSQAGPGSTGWVELIFNHNTSPGGQYAALTTTFTVPQPPPTQCDGQLIFLFPAQEPESQDMIFQPVLQWGVTGAGGTIGSCTQWTYAAWTQQPGGQFFHSTTSISPAPGDVLFGGEEFEFQQNGTEVWGIGGNDQSNSSLGSVNLLAGSSTSEQWTWAYAAVLESQGAANSCADFPGGTSGSNLWAYPSVLDQNGNPTTPPFSSCAAPTNCVVPEYSGPFCSFSASGSQFSGPYTLTF